jgi:hypothetical protein
LAAAASSLVVAATVLIAPSAVAGPVGNCDQATYLGAVMGNGGTAVVHCYAVTDLSARIRLTCWVGPVPTSVKHTSWVWIPAGSRRALTYKSNGWCESFAQTWVATGELG